MNIQGLNMTEISSQVEWYVDQYFKGVTLCMSAYGLFEESYAFDVEEVRHIFPDEYQRDFCI